MTKTRHLFTLYPRLAEKLSPCDFTQTPTPVEPLKLAEDGKLWVKRDDLSSSEYGGNKTRKLEFVLGEAQKQNKRRIITFGGLGTHHGLATAFYARKLGMQCEILLFEQPRLAGIEHNLEQMAAQGALLRRTGNMFNTLMAWRVHPRRLQRDTLFLRAGASTPLGALAYVDAACELAAQIRAGELPEPEAIYCATGSGGTLAGLTLGCALAGLGTRVHGVAVMPKKYGPFTALSTRAVQQLMLDTWRYLKSLDPDIPDIALPDIILHPDYVGGGYGVPTQAGEQALQTGESAGLKLDATYTAKSLAAAIDASRKHQGPVLYWHTLSATQPPLASHNHPA